MNPIRSFFAIMMLVLLLFPIADKAQHDLSHLNDSHCGITDLHYCQAEHQCDICDYIFSSSSTPPSANEQLNIFCSINSEYTAIPSSGTSKAATLVLFLRGPPACI